MPDPKDMPYATPEEAIEYKTLEIERHSLDRQRYAVAAKMKKLRFRWRERKRKKVRLQDTIKHGGY